MSSKNETKNDSEKSSGSRKPLSPEKAAETIELEIYRQLVEADFKELALNRLQRAFENAAE
jgi:hypothetical protein